MFSMSWKRKKKTSYENSHIEEVSIKWIDIPSVTEIDRGIVYEMERQTKCQTNGNATEMDNIVYDFLDRY